MNLRKFRITRGANVPTSHKGGFSEDTQKRRKFVKQVVETTISLSNGSTVRFFKQIDGNSCGYAMLANILSYYGYLNPEENPDTIFREINKQRLNNNKTNKSRDENLNSVDLIKYLQNRNFDITPIININQLKEHLHKKEFTFLYMMFDENSGNHYTGVIFTNGRYYLFDSLKNQPEFITEENIISRIQQNLDRRRFVGIVSRNSEKRMKF